MTDSNPIAPPDLAARLERLEARAEITNRMAAYGPSVDACLPDETADIWTEDGVYDIELDIFHGRDAIRGMVDGELHQRLVTGGAGHFIGVPYVEILGDTALALTHALLLVQAPEANGFRVWRVTATRWDWVRIGECWQLRSRINRVLNGSQEARNIFRDALAR